MAAKIRMSKLLQEIRGFAEIINRCPPPRSTGLLLTQMRPRVIHTAMPRRSLSVTMIETDSPDIPPGEDQSCEANSSSGGHASGLLSCLSHASNIGQAFQSLLLVTGPK
jgi:hypothetical protein